MRQLFSFFYWRWKKSGHHYPFFIILEKTVFALNTCAGRWFQVSWSLCRAMLSDREVHKFCMNVVYVPVSHTKISSGCTIADTITQFFCCPRTFRPILKPQQPGRRFRTSAGAPRFTRRKRTPAVRRWARGLPTGRVGGLVATLGAPALPLPKEDCIAPQWGAEATD